MINTISYSVKQEEALPVDSSRYILERKRSSTGNRRIIAFMLSNCASYNIINAIQTVIQKEISYEIHLSYGDLLIDEKSHNAVVVYNVNTIDLVPKIIDILLSHGLFLQNYKSTKNLFVQSRLYKQVLLKKESEEHFSDILFPNIHYFVFSEQELLKEATHRKHFNIIYSLFRKIFPEEEIDFELSMIEFDNRLCKATKLIFHYPDIKSDLEKFQKNFYQFSNPELFRTKH